MTFGERLRHIRKKRGLSLNKLAELLNVAPITVSRWERNQREPDFGTLQKLSEILDISIDYLLGKEDAKIGTSLNLEDLSDLPDEAIKSIEEFIDFVRKKYGKK
uniref:XRE family transcriptional regulator n=1 Tax=Dictyoglomus thermophilum TaxID=14 RepID=A0A7V3ZJT9_DICTH